jgi:CBS domain-containing protein
MRIGPRTAGVGLPLGIIALTVCGTKLRRIAKRALAKRQSGSEPRLINQSSREKRRDMRVEEIMTKEVACCTPGTNAATAAEIMWRENCGSLPVVENAGRVIGMVTDRDLFIALGTRNQRAGELPVGEIMNRDMSYCSPEDDVRDALHTMAKRQFHRLPVVNRDGSLTGILSIDDVAVRAHPGLSSDIFSTLKAICSR